MQQREGEGRVGSNSPKRACWQLLHPRRGAMHNSGVSAHVKGGGGGILVNTHDSGSHGLEFFVLGTGSDIGDIDCGLH